MKLTPKYWRRNKYAVKFTWYKKLIDAEKLFFENIFNNYYGINSTDENKGDIENTNNNNNLVNKEKINNIKDCFENTNNNI